MVIKPGTRVKVYAGDQSRLLGYGKYVGEVTIFTVLRPDKGLWSLPNAEERPTDEEIAAMEGELIVEEDNPKIVLDSGEIVYGCQVYWQECFEELN